MPFSTSRRSVLGPLSFLTALVASAACVAPTGEPTEADDSVAGVTQPLYATSGPFWSDRPIPVCWEGAYYPADVANKNIVRSAVASSWQAVSDVSFSGWGSCTSTTAPGIHIFIENNVTRFDGYVQCVTSRHPAGCDLNGDGKTSLGTVGTTLLGLDANKNGTLEASEVQERNCADVYGWPHTDGFGPGSGDVQSVHVSFNYLAQQPYFPGCGSTCITEDATHEFGHLLGYQHEQDRADDLGACTKGVTAGTSGITIGPFDARSTMNYCSKPHNNSGRLSFWDTVGHQQFYGSKFVEFGGVTQWNPAVAANADGRLEVFAVGSNLHVYHAWQTSVNGPFGAWSDLAFIAGSSPTLATNADGRLELFLRGTDGGLWHAQQQYVNGPFATPTSLGGLILYPPTVGKNADGRLEVFVIGTDNRLYHKWQTSPGGGYVASYAYEPSTYALSAEPALGTNVDGRMELFFTTTSGAMVHTWQTADNAALSAFSSLGGSFSPSLPPTVARNADGRMEVFAVQSDGKLAHAWQVAPNSDLSAWSTMGTRPFASSPAVFADADRTLQILGSSSDLGLVRAWQISANGPFTDFFSLRGVPVGHFSRTTLGRPAVGANADGRRELFVTSVVNGTFGPLLHNWETSALRPKEVDGTAMQGLIWE
jgi:hypothetical protein